MRTLLCLFLLVLGCSEAGTATASQFSRNDLAQIKTGMTIAQTEAILGADYTTIMDLGEAKLCQWIRGQDDTLSSINVQFESGKVKLVTGSNLK